MIVLRNTVFPATILLLTACGASDLSSIQANAIKAEQNQRAVDNPFQVQVIVSVQVAQELVELKPIATNETKPEPVIVPEPVVEPAPIVEEYVEPVTTITQAQESVQEVVTEITIDPDGETVFTYEDYSGHWFPAPSWVDSYSVGNRCFMYTNLDHGADKLIVDTPYGKRSLAMVQQLIGDGPGIGNNPRYNDVQCGNGPANEYGDEDKGECPGRIDQGPEGCGTIGPKWYFEQ